MEKLRYSMTQPNLHNIFPQIQPFRGKLRENFNTMGGGGARN
jgi:hypothetical protein